MSREQSLNVFSWRRNPNLNYIIFFISLLIAIFIGVLITIFDPDILVQLVIVIFFITIGTILALLNSKYLLVFILLSWAIVPEIRRIVDWLANDYSSVSLISIIPLLVTSTILLNLSKRTISLNLENKKVLVSFLFAILYGALIGFAKNKFSAIYEFLNYTIPFLLMIYLLSRNITELKNRDFWIRSLSNIAIFVAIYGWIQYLYLPPWDVFWINHVEMNSIGIAEPMSFRIFSTLNSPGPNALFLSIAVIPMIINKNWRGMFGIAGLIIVISALAITLVRTSWIFTVIGILIYLLTVSSNKKRIKSISITLLITLIIIFMVPLLPGSDNITSRFQTFSNLEDDNSFNARLSFTNDVILEVLKNPVGWGLGSTGVGTKLENEGNLGDRGNFDNGILNVFFTFGWIGAFFFFKGFIQLFSLSIKTIKLRKKNAIYGQLSLSIIVAFLFSLLSFNNLPGVGGLFMWFLISMVFLNKFGSDE